MKPPLFSCLTSRVHKNGSLYGRFLFGPLPIDISLTVATVLRRSLLHSQATFTIVSAEIEGAYHEYASLPGVQESVLEILLNLAEIVLTSTQRNFISPNFRTSIGPSEEPSTGFYFAFIRVAGPGIVTAKDINWPKGIFCVKPNAVIATLSSNETLTMRLKIACSLNKNRQSQEEIETKVLSIASENSKSLFERFYRTQKEDIESTFNIVKGNKTNKEFFTYNQNSFLSFKLQGKGKATKSTITSVKRSDVKSYRSTLLSSQFEEIKKKLKASKINETIRIKSSKDLVLEQTKQATLRLLANQTKSFDSYAIRKNKIALPFLSITNKQTIFNENQSISERSVINYDNKQKEKGEENQNSVTFLVFPGLFNHFIDLSSIKKKQQTSFNVQENLESRNLFSTEVKSYTSRKTIRQQNLLFNTETNTKNLENQEKENTKKDKQKKRAKYELAVSSSSYPVEKVNFLIERDVELAGYRHRIILEVWTNGSISPRQAIFESIGSIIKLIYNFREPLRNSFNQKFFHDNSIS